MTRISRWFLEITLDSETLRWWSGTGEISFESNTYTGLGTRWTPPGTLKRKSSLKSEKLTLEFDSSRQSDNSDPIGALLDEKWRRRQLRLRRIIWDTGDGPDDGEIMEDERGRIRNLSDSLQAGKPAKLAMEIESGALAYLERRRETRTPASQNAVFAGDKGFDLIAQLEGATLPWRTKHKRVGTVQLELQEEYEPYPRQLAIGRFVTPGSFVAAFTNGQQRKYMQRIYAVADHRINKLDKVWVNGDLVHDGALTHGARTLVSLEGDNGEYRCWVTLHYGSWDQTSDNYLTSVETTWTTDHRLRGVAYVIVEHLWDEDLPESFDYRFGGEGALLYDRRKDTTAGGSGSHRWDDPDTWEYSANAMVAADHYRAGIRIHDGSTAMWFGVGESPDAVPYAEFEELADHCDDNIALKAGGTQKRYEVNGLLSADDDHAKNLQKIADQMAARAIDQGGRISIRPPIVRTSVITLTDDDVVRGSESQADPGAGLDDMVNTISGRFINPANDYKRDDFPAVQITTYVDDDNGEISDTLDLDLENSSERAQRISKLKIEESRRIFEIEETYLPSARVIVPGEWFDRESTIRGFPGGKTFIAEDVERFLDGSIRVRAREVYPDQLVWDEETAVDLSEPPAFPQVALDSIEPPSLSAVAHTYQANGVKLPGVKLTIDYGANQIDAHTEVEVAQDDGEGAPDSEYAVLTDIIPAGTTAFWLASQLLPGVDYVIRVRPILGERVGEWTDWEQFTAPENFVSKSTLTAEPGGTLASTLDAIQVFSDDMTATVSDLDQALVDESSARASADSTVLATTRSESQRPNLMPPEYQLFGAAEYESGKSPLNLTNCVYSAGTVNNTYLKRDAVRLAGDGSSSTIRMRLNPADGLANMVLPPARYGIKVAFKTEGAGWNGVDFSLRDNADDAVVGNTDPDAYYDIDGDPASFSVGSDLVAVAVLDATSASTSGMYLQVRFKASSTRNGTDYAYPYRFHFVRLPAGVTEPGDWSDPSSLNALVSVVKEAFVDASTGEAVAKLNLVASAGGGNPTRIGLLNSDGTSTIALVAEQIFFGDDTVFEDTHNTIYTESGGYRLRILGPFPASGDLVIWYGPDSVSLNSETKTNGVFALATDGKVYFGGNDLSNEVGGMSLVTTDAFYSGASGSGKLTGNLNCTATGTTGTVSYLWTSSDPNVSFTAPTSATTKAQRDVTSSVTAAVRCLVTDSSGSKEAAARAVWTVL